MDRDSAPLPNAQRPLTRGASFSTPVPGSSESSASSSSAATFLLFTGLALTASLLPAPAAALGVGNPLMHSGLGQPLSLLFPLRLAADETLGRDCVRAEVMAGEARVPQGLLQFRLEGDPGNGQPRGLRLLSTVQIDEPIVTVNLSLGCPARLTRQFTAFVDPPDLRPTMAAPVVVPLAEAPAAATETITPPPAPQASAPRPVIATPPPAPAAVPRVITEAAPAPPPKPRPKPKPKPAPPPPPPPPAPVEAPATPATTSGSGAVSRLRMDPPELPLDAGPSAASAPASAALSDETLQRLQQLENKLDEVHRESVAAETQFKLLRAQLEEARQQRYRNVLVYGLGTFLVVLAGICAWLWRSRQRERQAYEQVWWNEADRVRRERAQQQHLHQQPAAEAAPPQVERRPAAPAGPLPPFSPAYQAPPAGQEPPPDDFGASMTTMATAFVDAVQRGPLPPLPPREDEVPHTAPLPLMDEALSLSELPPPRPAAPPPVLDDEAHGLSVEELIDLEQQVDFFEVLGQDEAATDLLRQRIAAGQASALPYLKLLEIHQRRGEELDFNEVAEQFARRFKAQAPAWGARLSEGRDLAGYPRVLDIVQQHWSDGGTSMALLQNLLSHGGEDGQGFDLPAYRDLLMLYGLAREQSERDVRGEQIDLFLPLDPGHAPSPATAMMATQPTQATPVVLDLHLDIDLDEAAPRPDAPR